MSIQDQITRIKTKVTETYTALKEKGAISQGTEEKLDSLPDIIENLDLSGGGGQPIADESLIQYIERSSDTIDNSTLTNLGDYSAYKSTFTSVSFDNVETIGSNCFENSEQLTTVSFPKAHTIKANAFSSCGKLATVSFPKVTSIGENAFYQAGLTHISDDNFQSLTDVGSSAFSSSKIKTIDHTGISIIRYNGMAANTELTSANMPALETVEASGLSYNNKLETLNFPALTSAGESAFSSCSSLTSVNLPVVTDLGHNAFASCSLLTSISFPELLRAGSSCFSSNFSLKSVNLPKLTTLGGGAFDGCSNITELSFPLLTEVEQSAFYGLENLKTLTLGSFVGNDHSPSTFLSSTFAYFSADKLSYVGSNCFSDCKNLRYLYLPSITTIEESAFSSCRSLQKIWIPSTCTIGSFVYSIVTDSPYVEIYTDAAEKPESWPSTFNEISSSVSATVHYGSSIEEFNNKKIIDASLWADNWNPENKVTINDGVVSFNNAVIEINNKNYFSMDGITLVLKFTTPDDVQNEQYLYYNNGWTGLFIRKESDDKTYLYRYDFDYNNHIQITTLEPGNTYYLKVKILGAKNRFFLSSDGLTYNYITENKIPSYQIDGKQLEVNAYIGNREQSGSNYWAGTIDLNGCYAKTEEKVLWTGILGDTPVDSTDIGGEIPAPEELDTNGLIAHWDFENTLNDSIAGISVPKDIGYIRSDEYYRGLHSYSPINAYDYKEYMIDISSLALTYDNSWTVSFQQHSDYYGNDSYASNQLTLGLCAWDVNGFGYDNVATFSIYNGGYNGGTINGKFDFDLSNESVKSILHSGWNKFAVSYDNSTKKIKILVNGTTVHESEPITDISTDYMNIDAIKISAYPSGNRNGQYIDDLCIYNKAI